MRLYATVLVVILGLCSLGASAYQRSEFLFLDEIQIGMTGIGKTIVAGDVISEFAVDVLGVIDQPGTLSDFIVVRVSGEAIGRSGGIAQGMSGSPIYIGGKLIGALSRAATWSKEIMPIGLVTPIEPMLEVLDSAKTVAVAPRTDSVLADIEVVERAFAPSRAEAAARPNVVFAHPVSSPLVAVGLSGRARSVLMNGDAAGPRPRGTLFDFIAAPALAPEIAGLSALGLDLLPLAGGTPAAGSAASKDLVPGGALGVGLVTGDISLGSLGTVTYVDGPAVIGFGHPFLSNGTSVFPLTTVSIVDTMKTLDASFKLGTLGEVIGVVSEDRATAIGGFVGGSATTIGLELEVTDLDERTHRTLRADVVNEPRLVPELVLSAGFEAIDTALDRVGAGTVLVTYDIRGDGMSVPLQRRDTFVSTSDIALYPPWQLAGIVAYLQYNEFADPKIREISASMEITRELRAIRVEGLGLDGVVYSPGDAVRFVLRLQTFQGEEILKEGELVIPEDLLADELVVRAYGGPRQIERGESPESFGSLDGVIDHLSTIPSYETVTVELFAVDPYLSDGGEALFGVAAETFTFPGHVVYDVWEARALLLSAATRSLPE